MTFLTLNEVVEIFMKKKLFDDKNLHNYKN